MAGVELGAQTRDPSQGLGVTVDQDRRGVLGDRRAYELLGRLVGARVDDLLALVAQLTSGLPGPPVVADRTHDDTLS